MSRFKVYATCIISAEVESISEAGAWNLFRGHMSKLKASDPLIEEFKVEEIEQDEIENMDPDDEDADETA